jgi:glycerophosphoryl diester phosphodiesterase
LSPATSPHSFFRGLAPTLNIAHRGGALLAPENTLAAFEIAIGQYHVDMLELDAHQTRDGVIVVAHDPTIDRCTSGSGAIADLTFAHLAEWDAGCRFSPDGGTTFPFRGKGIRIPSLEQVFRAFPGALFNIEVKARAPGIAERFAAVIRKEKMAARVCCGSESDELAAELAQALPECCHFYPRQALTELVLAIRGGRPPPVEDRYQVVELPLEYQGVRLIDAQLLDAAKRIGRWVNVWTVDDPGEMRRLIREGVGGIMTDRPDLLRQALRERDAAKTDRPR